MKRSRESFSTPRGYSTPRDRQAGRPGGYATGRQADYTRRATYAPVIVLATIAAVILLWLGQIASAAMDGIRDAAPNSSTDTYNAEEN